MSAILETSRMILCDRTRSRIMVRSAKFLDNWLDSQSSPRGQILCGAAGCRLHRDPDTTVGLDVAYIAANLIQHESDATTSTDGVPTLIVEIPSPKVSYGELGEKIKLCQNAGVPLIWVINSRHRTVTIYRLDAEPELVNVEQELVGDPHLPGFRVAVAEIFA